MTTVRWTQGGELEMPECQYAHTFLSLVTGWYSCSEDRISPSDLLSRRDSGISLSPGLIGQGPVAGSVVLLIVDVSGGALASTCDYEPD